MNENCIVTITPSVELSEIVADARFNHHHVFDLRCDAKGNARPIEEALLKRLQNHFISYDQIPMDMDTTGPCQEVHLCEMIREHKGNILIVTDHVASIAHLCSIYKIPFRSNVFYVVETGKGDVVKPFAPAPVEAQNQPAVQNA